MGFRLSRRIKIMPGLSLNFSTGGVSLSAGVRGAHVNFGPRGIYGTVGLPGTGLSYRQRLDGSRSSERSVAPPPVPPQDNAQNDAMVQELARSGGRVETLNAQELKGYAADSRFKFSDPQTGRTISRRELDSKIRDLERKDRMEAAQKQIDAGEQHYQAILNHWLPLPQIPSHEAFIQALKKYPFHFPTPPPLRLNLKEEQDNFCWELMQEYKRRWPYCVLPKYFARRKAEKELPGLWSEKQIQLVQEHAQDLERYDRQVAQESAAWDQQEEARIVSLKKLLDGDLEEAHHWALQLVESLQFPFDTNCDVQLQEARSVYINLDLPEIEDVIPAVRKKVLQSGEVREVNRRREEMNADYAYLIIGQSVLIAASLFACLPLAETVQVAAYTQRPRQRESDPVDTYVLDIPFRRGAMQDIQPDSNLVAYIIKQGGRINPQTSGQLGPIEPPSWLNA